MLTVKTYYFLLGGYDLEMVEIRKLLEAHSVQYNDRHLSWGATWSDYQDIIEGFDWEAQQLFGVELSGSKPTLAKSIDHHNELSHLPASIEQVANLLSVSLTRHQQLVAANDKGYIPAMREMGATKEEINKIRTLDRQAQGVTEEMEKIAEQDCRKKNTCNNITVIRTRLTKFSPIADRLLVSQLLIYNDSELTYHGKGAANLAQFFINDIGESRVYFGGGENGFFGIKSGYYSEVAIAHFVTTICTHIENEPKRQA